MVVMNMIRFEIVKGENNQYHWRMVAANNEIVCWSEDYASKEGAYKSLNWMVSNCNGKKIIEV